MRGTDLEKDWETREKACWDTTMERNGGEPDPAELAEQELAARAYCPPEILLPHLRPAPPPPERDAERRLSDDGKYDPSYWKDNIGFIAALIGKEWKR